MIVMYNQSLGKNLCGPITRDSNLVNFSIPDDRTSRSILSNITRNGPCRSKTLLNHLRLNAANGWSVSSELHISPNDLLFSFFTLFINLSSKLFFFTFFILICLDQLIKAIRSPYPGNQSRNLKSSSFKTDIIAKSTYDKFKTHLTNF